MTDNIIEFKPKESPDELKVADFFVVVSKYFESEFEDLFPEKFFKYMAILSLNLLVAEGVEAGEIIFNVDKEDVSLLMSEDYSNHINEVLNGLSAAANKDLATIH